MAHRVRASFDDDLFAPYEVIGELGERAIPVYVARQSSAAAGAQLVVAERFAGAGAATMPASAGAGDLRREARRISTLANPHLARVREVTTRGDDLVVFGDFIDGEKLRELRRFGEGSLPIEIAVRILLDVLTGAAALHGLRDANQQPMKLSHGEISPATILVGLDGVGRLLHTVARRAPEVRAEEASLGYQAPEIHAGDAFDGRADVFSIGVLLWEVLEGKLLAAAAEGMPGILVRSGALPVPNVSDKAPWAKALAPVVAKALAAAPEDRWATAAGMAAEIRKAAGLKLAPASAATAFAKTTFGERVKARRARLEAASPKRAQSALQVRAAASPPAPPVSLASAPVAGPSRVAPPVTLAPSVPFAPLPATLAPASAHDIPFESVPPPAQVTPRSAVAPLRANSSDADAAAEDRALALLDSLDGPAGPSVVPAPLVPVPIVDLPASVDVSMALAAIQLPPGVPAPPGVTFQPGVPAAVFAQMPSVVETRVAFEPRALAPTEPAVPAVFESPFGTDAAPGASPDVLAAPTPPAAAGSGSYASPADADAFASPMHLPDRSRRRTYIVLGGVATLGLVIGSIALVRGHGAAASASVPASTSATTQAVAVAAPVAEPPAAAPPVASVPAKVIVAPPPAASAKGGAKPKTPAAPAHPKRPTVKPKPGAH